MMSSRDETLENFQAFTGLEDVGTCMSILEQHGWNLLKAVNSVMPQEFPASGPSSLHASNTRRSNPAIEQKNDGLDGASAQYKPAPMSSSMINMTVHYNSTTYGITLPLTGCIKDLRIRLRELTGLDFEDQRLTGLPDDVTDETPFYNRKFDRFKNTVILHSSQEYDAIPPPKPPEPDSEDEKATAREKSDFRYKWIRQNRRIFKSRKGGYYYMFPSKLREEEKKRKAAKEAMKKEASADHDDDDSDEEKRKVRQKVEVKVKVRVPDSDSDSDVEKQKVKRVVADSDDSNGEEQKVPVNKEVSDSDDDKAEEEEGQKMKVVGSDSDADEEEEQKAQGGESDSDSDDGEEQQRERSADSDTDSDEGEENKANGEESDSEEEGEEQGDDKEDGEGVGYQSDDEPGVFDEDMFVSLETPEQKGPLIPPDCEEPSAALQFFSACFTSRYGEVHPFFYIGSLADAVREATGVPADQRKPMFIYLHHDSSILSNIFCSQLLCAESIVNYLSLHFIVWAWDLTTEELKRKLLDMVKESFGISVASNVDDISPDHLPVILIVFKSKGSVDVRDIIQGHTDPDKLLSTLITAYDQHQQLAEVDLLEERERQYREDMIKQQEIAYQDSLQADKEKMRQRQLEEEYRLQKQLEEQFERQKAEEELKKKDEERVRMSNCIPSEPEKSCKERVTTFKIRYPDGSTCQRRFLTSCHTLRMLLNYIGSQGFLPCDHRVLTSYPKRNISDMDPDLTLEEANLYPSETLHVEEES